MLYKAGVIVVMNDWIKSIADVIHSQFKIPTKQDLVLYSDECATYSEAVRLAVL